MTKTVIGTAMSMGWKRKKSGDKFQLVIELSEAPVWPIDIVWKSTPISLSIDDPDELTGTTAMKQGEPA